MKENRYCVYTALVGDSYDTINSPSVLDKEFDYICFVNKGSKLLNSENNVWKFIVIEETIADKGRLSRFPKLLPHKTYLSKYEYSLYIDANILIKDSFIYDRFKELAEHNILIALLQHPFRDCVYQEAYVCIAALKGGWIDILRQILFLKRKKYPKHFGLYEANVIFRKHNIPDVIEMDETWWKTFMNYSKRDQLSLVYALRESSLKISFFLPPDQTTRNHYAFEKIGHLPQKKTVSGIIKAKFIKLIIGVSRKILKD